MSNYGVDLSWGYWSFHVRPPLEKTTLIEQIKPDREFRIEQWAWTSLRTEDDTSPLLLPEALKKTKIKTKQTPQKMLPASTITQAIVKTHILESPMWRKAAFISTTFAADRVLSPSIRALRTCHPRPRRWGVRVQLVNYCCSRLFFFTPFW